MLERVSQNSEDTNDDIKKNNNIEQLINETVKTNLFKRDIENTIEKKILYENPLIFTVDNYLSNEECEHFIKLSKDKLKRAVVSGSKKGDISNGRTGKNCWVNHNTNDKTYSIGKRISKLINHPLENSERYQVIYYDKTQEYRKHYDTWDHDYSEKTLRCITYGGSRLITVLCYLNDVEEGGETKFTKLNLSVKPRKGRILVFENTHKNTNIKHPLSEHAGTPVIKGEKWAFNLWFRECSSKMLYKDFNPEYYKKGEIIMKEKIKEQVKTLQQQNSDNKIFYKELSRNYSLNNNFKLLNNVNPNIWETTDFISNEVNDKITSLISLDNKTTKNSFWIKKEQLPNLVKKIEKITNINSEFYENFNAIVYGKEYIHSSFLDAYDLKTDRGVKHCTKLGQRIYTIVIFLDKDIIYNFSKLIYKYNSKKNSILLYKNTNDNDNYRNNDMSHSLINTNNNSSIVLNLYIREKTRENKFILGNNTLLNINQKKEEKEIQNIKLEISEIEDYNLTYNMLFSDFKEKKINKTWKYESLTFTHKLPIEIFTYFLKQLDEEKSKYDNRSLINSDVINKTYDFDEYNPVSQNNILKEGVIDIFTKIYNSAIKKKIFPLGDRQSNRYKAHNESLARVLQYEILPVIEKITDKKLKPTYTYTSFYVKGADLPSHTDRPECQYTVSFVIDKPKSSSWNIYVDPKNQPIKNKGRCKALSSKEECIPVDCESNGLMIFCGEDHAHFREKLEYEYYNILLLHYRKIN